MDVRHLADGAVLAGYPDLAQAAANAAARSLARTVWREKPRWLLDAIPAARTLLVLFDPERMAHEAVEEGLRRPAAPTEDAVPRTVRVPTCYEGPDLEALARDTGLPARALVRLHVEADHRVAFLGFAPGFPYMTGAPRELSVPRLASPRLRVP